MNSSYSLDWRDGAFPYPNMVALRTLGDGSCFFHAIFRAFSLTYMRGAKQDKQGNFMRIDRRRYIRDLRNELADELAKPSDPKDPASPTHYQLLSRGQLSKMSTEMPAYKLEHMQRELRRGNAVNNLYHEYVSNLMEKDIYILDYKNKDVYYLGHSDQELLFKGRSSVVILYRGQHYETVGLACDRGTKIVTHFVAQHPFIEAIRGRMDEIASMNHAQESIEEEPDSSEKATEIEPDPSETLEESKSGSATKSKRKKKSHSSRRSKKKRGEPDSLGESKRKKSHRSRRLKGKKSRSSRKSTKKKSRSSRSQGTRPKQTDDKES